MFHQGWHQRKENTAPVTKVVYLEQVWRERPGRDKCSEPQDQVTVSRWTDPATARRCLTSVAEHDHHILSLALRPTEAVFSAQGRTLHSGRVRSGALQLSGPGQVLRGEFVAPSDALHVYFPKRVLSDCYWSMHGENYPEPIILIDPGFAQDSAIEQLGRQLLAAEELGGPHGRLCADGLILALTARLLNAHANCGPTSRPARARGLSKWRLKRARDYIEANLGEPLLLSDIAASTGLSRMHFAAQFRAATGIRPHEFVLRRRIERAQELIATPNTTLVNIALSVGFQTQAHFTTVFKRFVGETPSRWREYQGMTQQLAS